MKNIKSGHTTKGSINPAKSTGVSVPLGAVFTKKNTVIGEFSALPEFASFCKKAGLGIIQLLPVNDTGTQSSPYSGLSAFALHPIYIDLTGLPEFKTLYKADKKFAEKYNSFVKNFPYDGKKRYDYEGILNKKTEMLRALYETAPEAKDGKESEELEAWIKANPWIVNYAVYKNLKYKYMQDSWKNWPEKDRNPDAANIKSRWENEADKKEHLFYAWTQMRAAQQFKAATDAVKKAGIILKGDMPILMNEDSCDAWALPGIFNQNLRAGSPADGENPAGQNWGFPTYNWDYLKKNKYSWWKERLQSASQYYGAYRLDHILGFFRIWAIPVRETTAVLGHTEPNVPITKEQLFTAGFDDGRIRWLSQPHVPTNAVEDITWNHDAACSILGIFMNRIGNEDLWLFKDSVTGDKDIYEADLSSFCSKDAEIRVKNVLAQYWRNRCLISLGKDRFVSSWTYSDTTAWRSLSEDEKNRLRGLINKSEADQNNLWKTQSDEILSALTSSVDMVPCGEDLGANLPCLPSVMQKNGILSLRVIRWSRRWEIQPEQPFVPFNELPELSVATSSVHDSTTLRQWWNEDKNGVKLFVKTNPEAFGLRSGDTAGAENTANAPFSPEAAESFLKASAKAASVWCIHPLQDYLAMQKSYWLENADDERVNIPGTVSNFNWTYRMPVPLEDIAEDEELIGKIKTIASAHNGEA